MTNKMKVDEVLSLIHSGEAIKDVVITDMEEKRIGFKEAILLVENGFVVPSGNIVYEDANIAHDPEFDDVKWDGNYSSLSQLLKAEKIDIKDSDEITIKLKIEDKNVKEWLNQNTPKLKKIVNKLIVDLYHTDQMLHSNK